MFRDRPWQPSVVQAAQEFIPEGLSLIPGAVMGFADESRTGDQTAVDVQVLAVVPPGLEVPFYSGNQELKGSGWFKRFENLPPGAKGVWHNHFELISLFIVDPHPSVRAARASEPHRRLVTDGFPKAAEGVEMDRLRRDLLMMNPDVAFHFAHLTSGMVLHRFPDPEGALERAWQIRESTGDDIHNLLRLTVRAQALSEVTLNWVPSLDETGKLRHGPFHTPAPLIAASASLGMVYGDGHSKDIGLLLEGQHNKLGMTSMLQSRYQFPRVGKVTEDSSKLNLSLQLADIAAWYGRRLYSSDLERARLPNIFQRVYINGARMGR
ncbi:MAG: hypothetical protein ACYC96_16100, partial [Fimbriimonadaceae bacterium]